MRTSRHPRTPLPAATSSSMVVAIFALVVWLAILPLLGSDLLWAQNSVPPNARAAAGVPQLAARLALRGRSLPNASRVNRPANSPAHRQSPQACSQVRKGWLLEDQVYVYNNGPINGTTDAWSINDGFVVANSFTVSYGATVAGMDFGAWLFPGDVIETVEISITSQPFGGATYSDQVVNLTASDCSTNQYGFNVCTESSSMFSGPTLAAGTYWVNLQNAVVNDGDPVYWDENSGPSSAEQNSVGTIPSEAFTILGGTTTTTVQSTCMPEESGNFKVIHDFTGQGDGGSPAGVTVDAAGNLYGPSSNYPGAGLVYKLAQAGAGWVMDLLYDFGNGNNGVSPAGLIVRDGILYGSASGGNGYGQIFQLRPEPTVCLSTSCYWLENQVYAFSGPNDAAGGGGLVADNNGNLYGTSGGGGANGYGAVFELTPTVGGWIETILYSFASGNGGPTGVVVGDDGNLYGMTSWGGLYGAGVVFELRPSAGGWTETVLYNVPSGGYGFSPPFPLVRDHKGNLFGQYYFSPCCANEFGVLFELSPGSAQWTYSELWRGNPYAYDYQFLNNLTVDKSGNLYATGYAESGGCDGGGVDYGFVYEWVPAGNTWYDEVPVYWVYTYFPTGGPLAVDGYGNLYGTTEYCGTNGQGTVWQLSP